MANKYANIGKAYAAVPDAPAGKAAVLAVLALLEREAMDRMSSGFPRQADQLHEARAAVADAFAKAEAFGLAFERWDEYGAGDRSEVVEAMYAMRAALARVGGAA